MYSPFKPRGAKEQSLYSHDLIRSSHRRKCSLSSTSADIFPAGTFREGGEGT